MKKESDKPLRILLIDDSSAVLSRAGSCLKSAGYEVVATNQTVGIARFMKGCDLVVIDYHMPGLDGGDVLKSLTQAVEATSRPLFYLYTSDDELSFRARKLGFDGAFIDKGNDQRLIEQVNAAMRLVRLRARSNK